MKKLLIGLPVVAVVVFAAIPFMTGIVAEKKSKELVDAINVQSAKFGSIELVNYERGFMDSESAYKYTLAPLLQKATEIENIEYGCKVDHGITGVKYACLMAKKGPYQAFLDEFLGGNDPLSVTGNVSAFGGIDQTLAIDPVSVDFPDGPKVTISEQVAFTTEFAQGASKYDFIGEVPKVLIEKEGAFGSFNAEKITFKGSVEELRDGLYVGDVNMSGKQLKGVQNGNSIALNEFNVDTITKESGNTISSTMTMTTKSVEFPNQAGEMDSFSDMSLNFGMYGMDTDGLIEYVKVNEDIQKSIMAAGGDATAQNQAALTTMSQLIPVAEKLLKKGLGLNMESSFDSGGTNNKVSLDLSLINEIKFNQMMGFLFSPDETLKNFKGSLIVDLKKELIEKYPSLALAVGGIPFFVQTETGVTLDVSLDSVLKVNGEETTVAQLQSLFR